MKFVKIYGITLVLSCVFMLLGGWMLFDFGRRFYLATAVCAFLLAAVIYVLVMLNGKIEELEKRLRAFEENTASREKNV